MKTISSLSLIAMMAAVPATALAKKSAQAGASRALASEEHYETESGVRFLDQGWTAERRHDFYQRPQGSLMIPMRFAQALETADGKKFFTSENLRRYGYIPQRADPKLNPLGLPIGFTIDGGVRFRLIGGPKLRGERWIGMTCAACHTSNLRYQGSVVRIEGGPSMSDFQRTVSDMDAAVALTAGDRAKLDRFVSGVAALPGETADRVAIEATFRDFARERREWRQRNGTSFAFGGGRNDAFGVIFNQVLARDLHIPSNASEPNAPVSYPVIWDAPQHDVVQWNGLASNDKYLGGAMARNAGEVLGVFGHVDVDSVTEIGGFCSSIRRADLKVLEDEVAELWSPQWPQDVLPKIDPKLAAAGRLVYGRTCVGCHAEINRADPKRQIKAVLIPMTKVGTDTKMNRNATSKIVDTGVVFGRNTRVMKGRPLEAEEPGATVLKHIVGSALIGAMAISSCSNTVQIGASDLVTGYSALLDKAEHAIDFTPEEKMNRKDRTQAVIDAASRYKARPLNGIWSSAPFLHNGSVRSLKQLLTPAAQRETTMVVGCEEFDPIEVGLHCDSAQVGRDEKLSVLDLSLDGNRNSGHEYGTNLSDADKTALIEYIKSL